MLEIDFHIEAAMEWRDAPASEEERTAGLGFEAEWIG